MNHQDHVMIAHAANRQPVVVDCDGRLVPATLIAWKPHRIRRDGRQGRRNTARVEFDTGRQLTVKPDQVYPCQ